MNKDIKGKTFKKDLTNLTETNYLLWPLSILFQAISTFNSYLNAKSFNMFLTLWQLFEVRWFYFSVRCKVTSSLPEVFLKKGVPKICSKFTGEHPCQTVVSIKLQSNFIEITLRDVCSTVNLLHISRTPFPKLQASLWILRNY